MKYTIRQLLYSFLLGILAGLCLLVLLGGHCRSKATGKPVTDPAQVKASLTETGHRYQLRYDSLDRATRALRQNMQKTQTALSQAKRQNRSLESTIKDLLTVHYTTIDTTTLLANCDSLATTVDSLVIQSAVKDSLYDSVATVLQQQLDLRDSTVRLQQTQYDSLQASYHKTLAEQESLVKETAKQKKIIRRQQRGKGLLTAILAVVAGMFVYSSIK